MCCSQLSQDKKTWMQVTSWSLCIPKKKREREKKRIKDDFWTDAKHSGGLSLRQIKPWDIMVSSVNPWMPLELVLWAGLDSPTHWVMWERGEEQFLIKDRKVMECQPKILVPGESKTGLGSIFFSISTDDIKLFPAAFSFSYYSKKMKKIMGNIENFTYGKLGLEKQNFRQENIANFKKIPLFIKRHICQCFSSEKWRCLFSYTLFVCFR